MATSFIFAPMLLLFTAFGGTGNEILDVVDSSTYWKIAGIEYKADSLIPLIDEEEKPAPDLSALEALVVDLDSPEFIKRQKAMAALAKAGPDARPVLEKAQKSDIPGVATAATQILSKLGREASDSRLHRLMAIRSLGELKAAAAAPHLEKLTTSPEPFIGDYAARALASIRGEKYVGKKPDPLAYQKDLAITYPSAAAVLHVKTAPRDGDVGVRAMLEQGMAMVGGMGGMFGGGPGGMPEMDEILTKMTGELVKVFQRLGNIRIDSITGVMPTDVSPRRGGVIFTVRGLYDHKRALQFIKEEAGGDLDTTTINGLEWVGEDNDFYLHFASDELLVMVAGDGVEDYVKAVSARLSGDDKTPAAGPGIELAKAIPDTTAGFFAVEIPAGMAEADESMKIFKTLVGHMSVTEEGKLGLKVRLEGAEEKPVAELFTQMQMGLAMGKGAVAGMAKADKKLADLAEMMDSVKIKRDGSVVTGEAELPSMGAMPLGIVFGMFSAVRAVDMAPPPDVLIEKGPIEVAPDILIEEGTKFVPLEKAPDEDVRAKP